MQVEKNYQHLLTTKLYINLQLPSIILDNALISGFSEAFTHISILALKNKAHLKSIVEQKPPLASESSASGDNPWEVG